MADEEPADAVDEIAAAFSRDGKRLAVAESLTCGRLASAVGRGEDASEWFAGGVVAYAMDVKERVLGVEHGIDPCSPECAEQLAAGVRDLLRADIAVSTTGVGGPDPEGGHPPGTVHLGWATAEGRGSRMLRLDGDPDEVLEQTVDAAVAMIAELASPEPA